MKLPIEISPSPIIASSIEIRYVSNIEPSKLFPLVYSAFMKELPNMEQTKLLPQFKQMNNQLKYSPDYTLSNESYKLSFSNCVLSFENIADYKLWGNYFPFISKCVNTFFGLFDIEHVERVGVRYASVLDRTGGVEQILNFIPKISIEEYSQEFLVYRSNLKIEDMNIHLQIMDNANIKSPKKSVPSGLYIDIDASFTGKINADNKLLELIDKLHQEEKNLFFTLLKPEYIDTLNPKY